MSLAAFLAALRTAFLLGVAAAVLQGCASRYTVIDGEPVVSRQGGYQYVPPAGWYRTTFRDPRGAQYTRDGQGLQTIFTMLEDHRTAFLLTNRASSPDMLPHEIAERFVAELKANTTNDTLTVTKREPAGVAGLAGVRLAAQFRNEDGLRYNLVYYLAVNDDGLLSITFRAPALYYFDRYLAEFERSVHTLVLL